MIKHSLKFVLRNLQYNKTISAFNTVGLTLAVTSLLFIAFYLKFEVSYDKFHNDHQQIYNVYFDEITEGVSDRYIQSPMGLGSSLIEDFPEVQTMTRTYSKSKIIVKNTDGKEYLDKVMWIDSSFFSIFATEILSCSALALLNAPNQAFISQTCAKKHFGNEDPIGKTLTIDDQKYEITGILKDYPSNSHLNFDLLGSISTITRNRDMHEWDGYMYSTYIKLHNGVNANRFENKLPFLVTERLGPYVAKHFQLNVKEWFSRGNSIDIKLMPLAKIHLFASDIAGFEGQNNIGNVIVMIIAAILILLIACFNFVNFNFGLFRKSYKTTGIKTICGSTINTISTQSFLETLAIFAISSSVALIIIYSLRSFINELIHQPIISISCVTSAIPVLVVFGCLAAFMCGYLPSVRNTHKAKALLITRNLKSGRNEFWASKIFFCLQYTIAITILIAFFIINNQVKLLTNHDLGFSKKAVLIIHQTSRDRDKAVILAQELRKLSGIKAVSVTNAYPGEDLPTKDLQLKDSPNGFSYSPQYFCCDSAMLQTIDLRLIKGSFFSKNTPQNSILLNETALRTYNIVKHPIGQIFTRTSGETYTVIGVIKDFNFRSLYRPVEPMCMYTGKDRSNAMEASKILVKLTHADKQTMVAIKDKWNTIFKDAYFDYSFLEDEISSLYTKEFFLKKIMPVATLVAFLISMIGLLGITYIKMNEKTKEIGIRKVNGARVIEVVAMLNQDFIRWVMIAIIIACPIAWYAMHKWLQNFAYKTALSWWVFALAGAVAVAVALLTVSWQSWRAATRNPVQSLRYE